MILVNPFNLPFVMWPILTPIEVMEATNEWETKQFLEIANWEQRGTAISSR